MSVKNNAVNEELKPVSEIDGNPVVTHDEYLGLKIDDAISAKLKLIHINKVTLGCTIVEKKYIPKKPKKDDDGNLTGDFWDEKYGVELGFEGGRFFVRVDEPTYHSLEADGTRYIAKGFVESRVAESGFMMPSLRINSFEKIF